MRALLPRIPRALHLFFSLWASLRFCVSQGLAGLSGLRSVSLGFCGPLLVCLEFFWASQGCSGFRCIPLWVSRDLTSLGLCASLGLFELLSPSLAPSRGLWASTDLWISLGLAGILWTSLDLRGFLNLSGPPGNLWGPSWLLWAFQDLHGSPWSSFGLYICAFLGFSDPL